MRESLVEIVDDDPRVEQYQVPVDERRNAVVGIQVEQVLGSLRGSTFTRSMLMPFSARTRRVR